MARLGDPRSAAATGWLFLAPMLLALALAAGWPLARTVWFSFHAANLADPAAYTFAGLRNYLGHEEGVWFGVLADPDWWRAVGNTLVFTATSVALEACLGVAVALVLHASFPGRALVRAAVLVPWAVPTIVSAKIWAWMLNDQFGVVNRALLALGVIETPLAWTADPNLALVAVVMVDVWKTTPFVALLVLAALQMIPEQCYEAARLDGAGPLQQFAYITLPLIRPALIVAVIFRALDGLRVFDLFYVLTSNSPDTMSMSVYARQQLIDFQDLGYGSAASTLVFAVVALCSVLLIVGTRLRLETAARA
jgi:trehalose/maltose transport system permease protein